MAFPVSLMRPLPSLPRSLRDVRDVRVLRGGVAACLLSSLALGCSSSPSTPAPPLAEASTDAISEVDHTEVKRQSIGNCWIYATSSWLEALNKAAEGTGANTSESYITYWHWFDQVANGRSTEISTGGSFFEATRLIHRYGLMLEKDFIAEEAEEIMSARQASALAAVNESLKTGALSAPGSRTRENIRRELDKAWGLAPTVVEAMDQVFGSDVSKTLDRAYASRPLPEGTPIRRDADFTVMVRNGQDLKPEKSTLDVAMGWSANLMDSNHFGWQTVKYPSTTAARRKFQNRVQRALHDHQPVVISWFVDFNALDEKARFTLEELARRGGPGKEGGHMTVLHDYEIENVPGFGTLRAGELESRPEALEAALSEGATITFFRVKNSWGTFRPDRWKEAAIPGYHDLFVSYLNGPVTATSPEMCPAGSTPCTVTPWWDVTLPPGY